MRTFRTKRVMALLDPGEALYSDEYAFRGSVFLAQGASSLMGLGIGNLIWAATGHDSMQSTLIGLALVGIASFLLVISFRHTRVIAFTDRNVVIMDAPLSFPRRVIQRLPIAVPSLIRRGVFWDTVELHGSRYKLGWQSRPLLRRWGLLL
jgi:ABC-type anion transport system duplicated permease subunit